MKKLITLILITIAMISLVACTNTTTVDTEVSVVITDISKNAYYVMTPSKGMQYDIDVTVYCEEFDFTDTIHVYHNPNMSRPSEYYYEDGNVLVGTLRTEYDENGTVISQRIVGTHK